MEGPQAVRSLLSERPAQLRELFWTEGAVAAHPELGERARAAGIAPRVVQDDVLRAMVRGGEETGELPAPQGVLAVAVPDARTWESALAELPRDAPVTVVVLDELRDPGNVGTVIRTADASGADLVILSTGCADPYAPKVVRSSAGSLFHLPVVTGAPLPELLTALAAAGIRTAATSGRADADVYTAELPGRLAWILGNEAHGVSAETLGAADLTLRIPLAGRAESLNVAIAATVCLFETMRRRAANLAP